TPTDTGTAAPPDDTIWTYRVELRTAQVLHKHVQEVAGFGKENIEAFKAALRDFGKAVKLAEDHWPSASPLSSLEDTLLGLYEQLRPLPVDRMHLAWYVLTTNLMEFAKSDGVDQDRFAMAMAGYLKETVEEGDFSRAARNQFYQILTSISSRVKDPAIPALRKLLAEAFAAHAGLRAKGGDNEDNRTPYASILGDLARGEEVPAVYAEMSGLLASALAKYDHPYTVNVVLGEMAGIVPQMPEPTVAEFREDVRKVKEKAGKPAQGPLVRAYGELGARAQPAEAYKDFQEIMAMIESTVEDWKKVPAQGQSEYGLWLTGLRHLEKVIPRIPQEEVEAARSRVFTLITATPAAPTNDERPYVTAQVLKALLLRQAGKVFPDVSSKAAKTLDELLLEFGRPQNLGQLKALWGGLVNDLAGSPDEKTILAKLNGRIEGMQGSAARQRPAGGPQAEAPADELWLKTELRANEAEEALTDLDSLFRQFFAEREIDINGLSRNVEQVFGPVSAAAGPEIVEGILQRFEIPWDSEEQKLAAWFGLAHALVLLGAFGEKGQAALKEPLFRYWLEAGESQGETAEKVQSDIAHSLSILAYNADVPSMPEWKKRFLEGFQRIQAAHPGTSVGYRALGQQMGSLAPRIDKAELPEIASHLIMLAQRFGTEDTDLAESDWTHMVESLVEIAKRLDPAQAEGLWEKVFPAYEGITLDWKGYEETRTVFGVLLSLLAYHRAGMNPADDDQTMMLRGQVFAAVLGAAPKGRVKEMADIVQRETQNDLQAAAKDTLTSKWGGRIASLKDEGKRLSPSRPEDETPPPAGDGLWFLHPEDRRNEMRTVESIKRDIDKFLNMYIGRPLEGETLESRAIALGTKLWDYTAGTLQPGEIRSAVQAILQAFQTHWDDNDKQNAAWYGLSESFFGMNRIMAPATRALMEGPLFRYWSEVKGTDPMANKTRDILSSVLKELASSATPETAAAWQERFEKAFKKIQDANPGTLAGYMGLRQGLTALIPIAPAERLPSLYKSLMGLVRGYGQQNPDHQWADAVGEPLWLIAQRSDPADLKTMERELAEAYDAVTADWKRGAVETAKLGATFSMILMRTLGREQDGEAHNLVSQVFADLLSGTSLSARELTTDVFSGITNDLAASPDAETFRQKLLARRQGFLDEAARKAGAPAEEKQVPDDGLWLKSELRAANPYQDVTDQAVAKYFRDSPNTSLRISSAVLFGELDDLISPLQGKELGLAVEAAFNALKIPEGTNETTQAWFWPYAASALDRTQRDWPAESYGRIAKAAARAALGFTAVDRATSLAGSAGTEKGRKSFSRMLSRAASEATPEDARDLLQILGPGLARLKTENPEGAFPVIETAAEALMWIASKAPESSLDEVWQMIRLAVELTSQHGGREASGVWRHLMDALEGLAERLPREKMAGLRNEILEMHARGPEAFRTQEIVRHGTAEVLARMLARDEGRDPYGHGKLGRDVQAAYELVLEQPLGAVETGLADRMAREVIHDLQQAATEPLRKAKLDEKRAAIADLVKRAVPASESGAQAEVPLDDLWVMETVKAELRTVPANDPAQVETAVKQYLQGATKAITQEDIWEEEDRWREFAEAIDFDFKGAKLNPTQALAWLQKVIESFGLIGAAHPYVRGRASLALSDLSRRLEGLLDKKERASLGAQIVRIWNGIDVHDGQAAESARRELGTFLTHTAYEADLEQSRAMWEALSEGLQAFRAAPLEELPKSVYEPAADMMRNLGRHVSPETALAMFTEIEALAGSLKPVQDRDTHMIWGRLVESSESLAFTLPADRLQDAVERLVRLHAGAPAAFVDLYGPRLHFSRSLARILVRISGRDEYRGQGLIHFTEEFFQKLTEKQGKSPDAEALARFARQTLNYLAASDADAVDKIVAMQKALEDTSTRQSPVTESAQDRAAPDDTLWTRTEMRTAAEQLGKADMFVERFLDETSEGIYNRAVEDLTTWLQAVGNMTSQESAAAFAAGIIQRLDNPSQSTTLEQRQAIRSALASALIMSLTKLDIEKTRAKFPGLPLKLLGFWKDIRGNSEIAIRSKERLAETLRQAVVYVEPGKEKAFYDAVSAAFKEVQARYPMSAETDYVVILGALAERMNSALSKIFFLEIMSLLPGLKADPEPLDQGLIFWSAALPRLDKPAEHIALREDAAASLDAFVQAFKRLPAEQQKTERPSRMGALLYALLILRAYGHDVRAEDETVKDLQVVIHDHFSRQGLDDSFETLRGRIVFAVQSASKEVLRQKIAGLRAGDSDNAKRTGPAAAQETTAPDDGVWIVEKSEMRAEDADNPEAWRQMIRGFAAQKGDARALAGSFDLQARAFPFFSDAEQTVVRALAADLTSEGMERIYENEPNPGARIFFTARLLASVLRLQNENLSGPSARREALGDDVDLLFEVMEGLRDEGAESTAMKEILAESLADLGGIVSFEELEKLWGYADSLKRRNEYHTLAIVLMLIAESLAKQSLSGRGSRMMASDVFAIFKSVQGQGLEQDYVRYGAVRLLRYSMQYWADISPADILGDLVDAYRNTTWKDSDYTAAYGNLFGVMASRESRENFALYEPLLFEIIGALPRWYSYLNNGLGMGLMTLAQKDFPERQADLARRLLGLLGGLESNRSQEGKRAREAIARGLAYSLTTLAGEDVWEARSLVAALTDLFSATDDDGRNLFLKDGKKLDSVVSHLTAGGDASVKAGKVRDVLKALQEGGERMQETAPEPEPPADAG
ncbi:MAG TPA: hypothetical protein VL688_13040, partial [Verrucomicrobiae bacterium]|nr:hypothetical protein [Verrucomicrobiae bacterium]